MNELAKRIISYILIITCIITTIPYMDNSIQVNALAGFSAIMRASSAVGTATPTAKRNYCAVGYRVSLYCIAEKDGLPYLPQIAFMQKIVLTQRV